MRAAKVAVAAMLASALLISACSSSNSGGGGSSGGASTGHPGNLASGATFTVLTPDDPGALNPYQNIQTPGVSLFKYLYDYLVTIAPDGTIQPELATSWTVNGATSTFKLRTGVTCSDGSPLTASTIAQGFNYIKDPANKSVLIGVALPSANYTATGDDSTNTFTLTFDKPFGFLLQALSLVPIVCGKGLANPASLNESSSGSGPFVLTKATPGVEYDMDKRAGYSWGPNAASTSAPGFPDHVVEKIVASQSTAANLLIAKSANAAVINGPDGSRLTGSAFQSQQSIQGGIEMLFNESTGRPTADLAVRKALIMALDIPQVSAVVSQGLVTTAGTSLTPSKSACDDSSAAASVPKGSLTDAENLLTQDGWVAGADGTRTKDGKALSLTAPYLTTSAGDAPAMDLIVAAWKKLGVKVTQDPLDQAAFSAATFSTGNYDVLPLTEFAVPFQSILTGFLSGPPPPNGINSAHINTSGYTSASQQAVATNGPAGCQLWTQAAQALYTNADIIPISQMVARFYTSRASFSLGIGRIVPSSIRLYDK